MSHQLPKSSWSILLQFSRCILQLSLLILASGLSNLTAQPELLNEGSRIVTLPSGGKVLEWYGKLDRTYFIQVSDPTDHLIKWKWVPIIEGGNNQLISYEVASTADKAFFRLQFTDQTAADLDNADFDGDGLSNIDEITPITLSGTRFVRGSGGSSSSTGSTTTNPLDADTDKDGTSDGDERANGSDPRNPNSGGTPMGSDAGGTHGNPSPGGAGNTPNLPNEFKLVYRGAINNQFKWYNIYAPSVELFSSSLLTHFSDKIDTVIPAIKVDLHSTGVEDDETINTHPDSETATVEYRRIATFSSYEPPPSNRPYQFTDGDASAELFALFAEMEPAINDDLSTWKKLLGGNLKLGADYQASDSGLNPLWTTSRSTARYQFGIIADQTSTRTRDLKWDFLQILTINDESVGFPTQELADPPLVSKNFTILSGQTFSSTEKIDTPETQITPELGISKEITLVPVQIADNLPATGVDVTSRTASTGDIGYQAHNWIMAPAGNVPVSGTVCNNAMQFKVPLPPGTRLKISCPGVTPSPAIISPRVGGEPTVAWKGIANASSDQTPIFEVGTEESVVDLPIRVKVMKNRKLKVKVHLVNQQRKDPQTGISYPAEVDPSMVPTKAELENHLNPLFAYQINTWFDVTIAPAPLVVDFSNNMSINPDNPTADQNLITSAIPGDLSDYHINVFIVGKVGTLNASYGSTSPAQATCWILGKPINNYLTKQDLLETIGHEIGHVFFDLGHPNATSVYTGKAPLLGTDHSKRLMCDGANFSSNSRLIVKAEWDAAEEWLKAAEIPLPMNP